MARVDLTVEVHNLSNNISEDDLTIFFSYCGTVDDIKLESEGDHSKKASVIFRQPYAQKIALLLDDAAILDRRVRIIPVDDDSASFSTDSGRPKSNNINSQDAAILDRRVRIIPVDDDSVSFSTDSGRRKSKDIKSRNEKQSSPTAHPVVQAISYEALKRARELDEKLRVSERSRLLTQQAKLAIAAAEKSMGHVRSAVENNDYFSAALLWLSGTLDKAAKSAAELGHNVEREMNSRKRK
ncbi:uncharacterized protein LOC131239250 [Magnolia sinica]|uniref:uncharacterized protein LOC131239250 n=1 Tax=Magnolia sinica TaxID=86752 RepID=UPI00265B08D5|nr:uncharacterized protein LOC131239250 [Magnolia sinica]